MIEDDFQRQLDANPRNGEARLLLADWFDEHGDARGPGYRALAVQKRWPLKSRTKEVWWWFCPPPEPNGGPILPNYLWQDWFSLLHASEGDDLFWPGPTENAGIKTRRECEDAAALAFSQLPSERQAELLIPQAT